MSEILQTENVMSLRTTQNRMNISLVIPSYNEAESLPELHSWIVKVMSEHGFSYEVIFVDDGLSLIHI